MRRPSLAINKRRRARVIVMSTLTTERHTASRGFSATVELTVMQIFKELEAELK